MLQRQHMSAVRDTRPSSLSAVQTAIISCNRCERLRSYCQEVGRTRKAAFRNEVYWARPVPGFRRPERPTIDPWPRTRGAWRQSHRPGLHRRRRRRLRRLPDGGAQARGLCEHRDVATHRRWIDVEGRLHRGGRPLRTAGEQAAARRDRSLPGHLQDEIVASPAPAGRGRARQDCVGRVVETADAEWRTPSRVPGRCSDTVRSGSTTASRWSARIIPHGRTPTPAS